MKDWQERVIQERERTGERYKLLCGFIGAHSDFALLPSIEQMALIRQRKIMAKYLGILTERIARFEE